MLEFSTVAKDLDILCIAVVNHSYFSHLSCSCMVISLNSGLQFDILRNSIAPQPPPVLVYHGEGDCVWEIKIEGNSFPAPNTADGHRLPLLNSFSTGINVKCAVNGTELLDAIIVARG